MAEPTLITDSTPRNHEPAVPPLTAAQLSRAVGQRLCALRRERGLSQEELAWRAGLHRTRISQIERGIGCPKIATLYRLALALGMPLAVFCPETGAAQRSTADVRDAPKHGYAGQARV